MKKSLQKYLLWLTFYFKVNLPVKKEIIFSLMVSFLLQYHKWPLGKKLRYRIFPASI